MASYETRGGVGIFRSQFILTWHYLCGELDGCK